MPGTYEEKFANLRLFYGYWMTFPGKKLLFMGGEFGQFDEWKDAEALDWMLLDYPMHGAMYGYMRDLSALYAKKSALWECDHSPEGFQWIDADNAAQSVITFIRWGKQAKNHVIVICNFSNQLYPVFRLGVPSASSYRLVCNGDAPEYGGSGHEMPRRMKAERRKLHGQPCSVELPVPPLSFLLLEPVRNAVVG
jgi:1,4-alpha-glucan branching enzyme